MATFIYLCILATIAAAAVWGTRAYVKSLKAQAGEETTDVFDRLPESIPFPHRKASGEE